MISRYFIILSWKTRKHKLEMFHQSREKKKKRKAITKRKKQTKQKAQWSVCLQGFSIPLKHYLVHCLSCLVKWHYLSRYGPSNYSQAKDREPSWDHVTSSHTGRRNLTVPWTSWREEATRSSQKGKQGRHAGKRCILIDSLSLMLFQPPGPAGLNVPTALHIRTGDVGSAWLAIHPTGLKGSENTLRFTSTQSLPNHFSSSLIVSDIY